MIDDQRGFKFQADVTTQKYLGLPLNDPKKKSQHSQSAFSRPEEVRKGTQNQSPHKNARPYFFTRTHRCQQINHGTNSLTLSPSRATKIQYRIYPMEKNE
mmetsp:Transcript_25173/g.41276  ORF Transcript_25173/g.41276 Transcript_25173/m.41276 type:complete len:100 (-) Transcript_25173:1008-1307(-)